MKRLVLVVVAAIATALAPLAVARGASHKTSHKTVSLSGGQSVSVTCSGKSLTVVKSGNVAVLACASAKAKAAPKVTAPPVTAPPVTTPPAPVLNKNAVQAAKQYLNAEPGFSQAGLIAQLDSPDGSGFSVADATAAVDSLTVNWDAQAVDAAKNYNSSIGGFSCSSMIQQLDSPDGGQFTVAQATYGATQAGDC
jgi:hypothetical protein